VTSPFVAKAPHYPTAQVQTNVTSAVLNTEVNAMRGALLVQRQDQTDQHYEAALGFKKIAFNCEPCSPQVSQAMRTSRSTLESEGVCLVCFLSIAQSLLGFRASGKCGKVQLSG
jgi:hypothetical protein